MEAWGAIRWDFGATEQLGTQAPDPTAIPLSLRSLNPRRKRSQARETEAQGGLVCGAGLHVYCGSPAGTPARRGHLRVIGPWAH